MRTKRDAASQHSSTPRQVHWPMAAAALNPVTPHESHVPIVCHKSWPVLRRVDQTSLGKWTTM